MSDNGIPHGNEDKSFLKVLMYLNKQIVKQKFELYCINEENELLDESIKIVNNISGSACILTKYKYDEAPVENVKNHFKTKLKSKLKLKGF